MMKIINILNEEIKYIDKNIPIYSFSKFKNLEKIGSGAFANVFKSNSNPNEVIKIARLRSLNDPTLKFVRLAMNNKDNPHFPRISAAKVFKNNENKNVQYILVIRMEKLIPFNNPRVSHLLPVFMRQLGMDDQEIKDIIASYSTDDNIDINDLQSLDSLQLSRLGNLLQYEMQDPENIRYYGRYTKNEKLGEALTLLYKLILSNNSIASDIHEENIMVRLGNPPQLVITDPIFEPIQ